jgi:hypothetical protein
MTRGKRLPVIGWESAPETASREPTPHESIKIREDREAVRDAVAALPESERTVVPLYCMGGRSQSEIAGFLKITPNAVKTRLYSARRRLRKRMESFENQLHDARPSGDPEFARRVIRSALPLQFHALDAKGELRAFGGAVGSRAVERPQGPCVVEPRPNLFDSRRTLTAAEWDSLLDLMREFRVEGLSLERELTDALLERISRLDHLSYLSIPASKGVTDDGLRHLARMPQLEHLDLSGCSVTDRGLEVLSRLPNLKSFKMVHSGGVSDAGLAALGSCMKLERVNLMGTPTGDGIVRALAGKPNLDEFYAGNEITDDGLALLHEFPMFKTWQGGEAALSLMSGYSRPNFLWLNLKAPFTDAGIARLTGLDGLFALSLFGSRNPGAFDASDSEVTPAGLAPLASLPQLTWLGCTNELCDDEAMRRFRAIPRLRFLMCQDAVAGDDGFEALSGSASLEYIWGRRCYNLTGRGFAALAALAALRGLSVSCKSVGDAGLSALPDFPALREFMPMDVPDEGFRYVGRCEALEALYAMYCTDTTDAATAHLTGLPRLKLYRAWSVKITDRSLESLSRIASLERIGLYDCPAVTDAGLAFLAKLPRLEEFDFESLPLVTPNGAAAFPARVRVNATT